MRKINLLLSCLILALCVSACTTDGIVNETIRINQERANEIISALTRYQQVYGQFPDQLASLVPTYLKQMPVTLSGQGFEYTLDTLEGYYLTFHTDDNGNVGCGYNQRLKGWDCSRGD
jgi:hypothetical protein